MSAAGHTSGPAAARRLATAMAFIAAVWTVLGMAIAASEAAVDPPALGLLFILSLAAVGLSAATPAAPDAPAGEARPTTPAPLPVAVLGPPAHRRRPRIVVPEPCWHCGRNPHPPRRSPRIVGGRIARPVQPEPPAAIGWHHPQLPRRGPRILVRH